MNKLKLTLEDLEVSSFAADEKPEELGTVNGLSGYYACRPSAYATECLDCTEAEGCYGSLYCSQGDQELTCAVGCMTNEHGYC